MKTSLIVIISVLTILILCVNDSQARLTSSVALLVREDYNDNIYLTDTNRTVDLITKVRPSFTLDFSSGRHKASIKYNYEWQNYARNPKANAGIFQGSASVSSVVVERLLTVNISEVSEKTASDTRRPTSDGEVLVNIVEQSTFTFNPVLHRNISKVTTLRAGYDFISIDYNDALSNYNATSIQDTTYNNVYAELERRLSKRLVASTKYEQKDKKTQDDVTRDFVSQNVSISSSMQLTPETSFDATLGRSWYDYETRGSTQENFWSFSAETKVMSTGTATLGYSRQTKESPSLGTYLSEAKSLKLSFGKRLRFTLGGSTSLNQYLTSLRTDERVSGNAALSWQTTRKLELSLTGNMSNQKYTLPDEEVDQWGSSLGANYRLGRHFIVSASFRHSNRDSTIAGRSYENNVTMLSVLATY